jgi:hypothetical protein
MPYFALARLSASDHTSALPSRVGPRAVCSASARAGRPIDTRKAGRKTFRVNARDRAGNVGTKLVRYVVTPSSGHH